MKVNVSVEATAQEMREFLGLPNVQPLQEEMLQTLRDNIQRGAVNFDALGLLKPMFPTQFHSMEMVQKFWEAVAKASTSATKDIADPKAGGTSEPRDKTAPRDGAEKS
jgi:hypothetical protein